MQRLFNRLDSTTALTVICPEPEAFLTLCAGRNISFWNVHRLDALSLEMTVYTRALPRLRSAARRCGGQLRERSPRGALAEAKRLRKRWALLGGVVLSLLLLRVSSLYVWSIRVEGNEAVPAQRVLSELAQLGFAPGTFGPTVDSEKIANEMLLRIPELSWLAINVSGTKAQVLVRERVGKPELSDPDEPRMIVAAKGGLIRQVICRDGVRLLDRGCAVLPGEVIVSGIVPTFGGDRLVHASAEVYASTWYSICAATPLEYMQKQYTGREKTQTSLIVNGKRINFYRNSGIERAEYDKITQVDTLSLADDMPLPVSLLRQRLRQYVLQPARVDLNSARTHLQRSLLQRLTELSGGGQIVSAEYTTEISHGRVTVTLRAECLEQIAAERPLTERELASVRPVVREEESG